MTRVREDWLKLVSQKLTTLRTNIPEATEKISLVLMSNFHIHGTQALSHYHKAHKTTHTSNPYENLTKCECLDLELF